MKRIDSNLTTPAAAGTTPRCGGLAVALLLAVTAATPCAANPVDGATAEALVARGVELFRNHRTRSGLADLEAAVALAPELPEARAALAAALLRGGRFERAALGFERAVGEELVLRLSDGTAGALDVSADVDHEAIFGLAICRAQLGLHREADRLYRIYADLVGVTEPAAAKAYYRLAEMLGAYDLPWGDAEAEMTKARAIDPSIETKELLVDFPPLASIPRFAPYTWPIELSPNPPDSLPELDDLPVLISWVEPDRSIEDQTTVVDLLVESTGRVADVRFGESADADSSIHMSTTVAAMKWIFEPALADDDPVPAWIRFSIIHRPDAPAVTVSP